MASIIQMEAGSPHVTDAKTFFSLSIAILLYVIIFEKNLADILSDDLQVIIFWAGVFLLILSVAPLVKWGIHGIIYIFWDRKLPERSFSYWDTLNQPQWEKNG